MTPFNLYKHVNNTDVAIMPMSIFYVKEKQIYKLKVRWINIVLGRDLDMGIIQKIEIKKEHMQNWKLYGTRSAT